MEGVDAAIGADFPAFGHTGNRFGGGVKRGQPLKERFGDAYFGLAGNEGGVERFGLCAVEENQVGPLKGRTAPCQEKAEEEKIRRSEKSFQLHSASSHDLRLFSSAFFGYFGAGVAEAAGVATAVAAGEGAASGLAKFS